MVAVPIATPDTIPVEPTVAVPAAPELQVPPPVLQLNVIEDPWHTAAADGEMEAGRELTVTVAVL
jgi:hypothetical protein